MKNRWRCCCCGRVFHRKCQPHRCATGYTKSWHKVAEKLGLTDAWTRYCEFGDYELVYEGLPIRFSYVIDFSNGSSELHMVHVVIRFTTGMIVVLGETSLGPVLRIPESVSFA